MSDESKLKTLAEAISAYCSENIGDGKTAHAILYTPEKCSLLLLGKNQKFLDHQGEFTPHHVFEARIFNESAELRWLHESDGKGTSIVVNDESFPDNVGTVDQHYLLWGERLTENAIPGWTKFGSARIGSYWVPIQTTMPYARFKAVEYLKTYEDGNVAVVDERLTGIEEYKGE